MKKQLDMWEMRKILAILQKQPPELFYKKAVRNIHQKTPVLEFLFSDIFKNNYLDEHLQTAASDIVQGKRAITCLSLTY